MSPFRGQNPPRKCVRETRPAVSAAGSPAYSRAERHHRTPIPRGPAPRQGCQRDSPKKARERGESHPRPTNTIVNPRFRVTAAHPSPGQRPGQGPRAPRVEGTPCQDDWRAWASSTSLGSSFRAHRFAANPSPGRCRGLGCKAGAWASGRGPGQSRHYDPSGLGHGGATSDPPAPASEAPSRSVPRRFFAGPMAAPLPQRRSASQTNALPWGRHNPQARGITPSAGVLSPSQTDFALRGQTSPFARRPARSAESGSPAFGAIGSAPGSPGPTAWRRRGARAAYCLHTTSWAGSPVRWGGAVRRLWRAEPQPGPRARRPSPDAARGRGRFNQPGPAGWEARRRFSRQGR